MSPSRAEFIVSFALDAASISRRRILRSLDELAWVFANGSNRSLQNLRRAGALNERNQGHFSSPTPHFVRAYYFFFGVVFTFDEHIRSYRFDQIQRSLFIKKDSGINVRESRHQPCTRIFGNNRA